MTAATCAHYIDRTPKALRTLVSRGLIPFHRVRRRLVFGHDEIDWCQDRRERDAH